MNVSNNGYYLSSNKLLCLIGLIWDLFLTPNDLNYHLFSLLLNIFLNFVLLYILLGKLNFLFTQY